MFYILFKHQLDIIGYGHLRMYTKMIGTCMRQKIAQSGITAQHHV